MVGVRDGDSFRLFVDGAQVGDTTDAAIGYTAIDSPFEIGSFNGAYTMHGLIDSVAAYNRALTAPEVARNYGAQGAGPQANNAVGVRIAGGAANNTVGGTTAADRNVISGNAGAGVTITGAGTTGNVVAGNYVGTDAAGAAAVGNGYVGVWVDTAGSTTIGGGTAGARNVISGGGNGGIYILHSPGARVQGNYVGLTAAGDAALPNGGGGGAVFVQGSPNTIIGVDGDGSDDAGEGNVLATAAGGTGLSVAEGSPAVVVAGNYFGLNAAGSAALGGGTGIRVSDAFGGGVRIGTDADGVGDVLERNVVANGMGIDSSGGGVDHLVVAGNYFGTDKTGLVGLGSGSIVFGNGTDGVRFGSNADGVRDDVERNVVAALDDGIFFYGDNNTVAGNYVGLGADGSTPLPVRSTVYGGVIIAGFYGATGNVVGGTTAAARNVIAGNAGAGVLILDPAATGNTVAGNYIGTDATGTLARANATGVVVGLGAHDNTIGGTAAGAGNVISGNAGSGVQVSGAETTNNTVAGNTIGLAATQRPDAVPGLVSWYTADGTAADAAGGHDGTLVNGATFAPGLGGQAFSLNGTNQYVQVPADSAFDVADFTLQAWVYVDAATNVGWRDVISRDDYLTPGPDGREVFTLYSSSATPSGGPGLWVQAPGGQTAAIFSPDPLITGWHHLAGVRSGTVLQIYVDGALRGTATLSYTGVVSPDTPDILIGASHGGPGVEEFFKGLIDDAAVYSRALSGGRDRRAGRATPLGNTGSGVLIDAGAAGNTIGGTTAGARNVISGNAGAGVNVSGTGTDGNVIQGNYVGLAADGLTAVGNTQDGVIVQAGAANTLVGGTAGGAGNVISGNRNGIQVNAVPSGTIQGNVIGLDAAGDADRGNSLSGIVFSAGAGGITVGGTTVSARNVISGNDGSGVFLAGGGSNSTIAGNYIGTDATGTRDRGNALHGVHVVVGQNVVIGAQTADPGTAGGNVIAGNDGDGVLFAQAGHAANLVVGNLIGLSAAGTALGNAGAGVRITGGADNMIGETAAGSRNVISGNAQNGVALAGSGTTGNTVAGNYVGTNAVGGPELAGLVGWWKGDGNATDSAGDNDGTLVGGATFAAGKVGQGVRFNGVGAAVAIPHAAALDFERTDPFSIEAWAAPGDLAGTEPDSILPLFVKGPFSTGGPSYGVLLRPGFGGIDVFIEASVTNRIYWRGPVPATVVGPHHYAVTYDGSSTVAGVRVFVDGVEIFPTLTENTLTASIRNTSPAGIGPGR